MDRADGYNTRRVQYHTILSTIFSVVAFTRDTRDRSLATTRGSHFRLDPVAERPTH